MKWYPELAAGVLLAATAQGFSLGGNHEDQINFQLPGNNMGDHAEGLMGVGVKSVLASIADAIGDKFEDIPAEAFGAWAEVITKFPKAVSELSFETAKKAGKKLTSKVGFTPRSDWLHIVEDSEFPQHALRVRNPEELGVDTVKQYSGYLDVKDEDAHFFYWFFESRNDPENDPVVLWLNGGPGCSSTGTGLFFELGPARISEEHKPVRNDWAWNNNASVIYLDQPVGTGYSYGQDRVDTTPAAAHHFNAFVHLFFKKFPQYKKNNFHIAGESYAGHYIPVFADELVLRNKDSENPIDLKSVLIGNGLTDPLVQYDGYYRKMACGEGGAPAVLTEEECQNMADSEARCLSLINSCYQTDSAWTCVPATIYCNNVNMGPYQRTGLNVYDIRKECKGELCYDDLHFVDEYLNLPEVKAAVGAEVEKYQSCNFDINKNFLFAGDWMKPFQKSVANLLEDEIPVLIYAGDKDFICNWLGNQAWPQVLEWSGQKDFADAPTKPWTVNGDEAGTVQNSDHFTFLRVYEAGHMVPHDQAKNSVAMLNTWLSGNFNFEE
ncbi:carboxypeptidase Y [Trichomonascus vanleenenianus]|uniref:carboxypeptidase Y n=1 Tax=Trichomonascus vanleenenianus TaxID=2268995 RepID=UPI003ECA8BCB